MSSSRPSASPALKPLRSALRDDSEKTPPISGVSKAVQIAEPNPLAAQPPPPSHHGQSDEIQSRKQFTANLARRLSGRPPVVPLPSSSRTSLISQSSTEALSSYMSGSPMQGPLDDGGAVARVLQSPSLRPHHHHHRGRSVDQASGRLLTQLAEWLQHEKNKKATRKAQRVMRHHNKKTRSPPADGSNAASDGAKSRLRTKGSDAAGAGTGDSTVDGDSAAVEASSTEAGDSAAVLDTMRSRAMSTSSASSDVSLDRLQRIIDDGMAAMGVESIASLANGRGRRPSRSMRYQPSRTAPASSDTEYADSGDVFVPSCDAVLDNRRTIKYAASNATSNAGASSETGGGAPSKREEKERQAWVAFKNEIIRLAHTLRLKGWRKVPLDAGETISVERLSGALTNAVYVVLPPSESFVFDAQAVKESPGMATAPVAVTASTPGSTASVASASATSLSSGRRSQPNKLLLRIYGPQVEHLIDRENELFVLRRLGRKKIGPRLLGTFANGRFEEFLDASALTSALLRDPETSEQIAKRMRELHDGIELLEQERDGGPNVWRNWDRWLDTVERTTLVLDREVLKAEKQVADHGMPLSISAADAWRYRGFVCGVEWAKFRAAVEKYREHVNKQYGGASRIRDQLIFSHNDTQYGNILRLRPRDNSPLLDPENRHKQLVVIDFEYAAANPLGIEFANHFTEWTYNYHDSVAPHACNTVYYPSPEQQRRFLRAYVCHRPAYPHQSNASTPRFGPLSLSFNLPSLPPLSENPSPPASTAGSTQVQTQAEMLVQEQTLAQPQRPASSASSVAEFMLDARVPLGGWKEEEERREEHVERQVESLMAESRLWRIANSVQWVAWGIVQAKVPGLDLAGAGAGAGAGAAAETNAEAETSAGEADLDMVVEEDGFDYLAYSQERVMFFWGDCLQMGIVRLDELPSELQHKIKIVEY